MSEPPARSHHMHHTTTPTDNTPTTNTTITSTTSTDSSGAAAAVDPWRVASSRAVHPSAHSGEEPLVAVIAAGLAAVSVPWELSTGTHPTERCYELLLATDQYDAWLIHWPAGTGLDAHDHGGSTGAFAVVGGLLDEDITVDGRTVTRRFGAGQTAAFDGDHVHAVINRADVGATSVHVYSPPLRTMSFYRDSPTGDRAVARVEPVSPAELQTREPR
ncbi:MAG: cysteine dioxygenase family protein [Ilumatobacteraceae bacterium]